MRGAGPRGRSGQRRPRRELDALRGVRLSRRRWRRRARGAGRDGSAACGVCTLAGRVLEPSGLGALVALTRRAKRAPSCREAARVTAVALTTEARPAELGQRSTHCALQFAMRLRHGCTTGRRRRGSFRTLTTRSLHARCLRWPGRPRQAWIAAGLAGRAPLICDDEHSQKRAELDASAGSSQPR